jgi:hypothetical protein
MAGTTNATNGGGPPRLERPDASVSNAPAAGAATTRPITATAHRLRHFSESTWAAFADLASSGSGATAMVHRDRSGSSAVEHLAAAEHALRRAARSIHKPQLAPEPADGRPPMALNAPQPLLQLTWLCRAADDLAATLEQAAALLGDSDDETALLEVTTDSIGEAERHVAQAERDVPKTTA